MPDALHGGRPVYLGEERCDGVASRDAVPGGGEQAVPLCVVDRLPGTDLASKDFDCDFSEPLTTEPLIEILEAKLGVLAQECSELAEQMLVAGGVLLDLIREGPEAVCSFPLLDDLCEERSVLLLQVAAARSVHFEQSTVALGRVAQRPGVQRSMSRRVSCSPRLASSAMVSSDMPRKSVG